MSAEFRVPPQLQMVPRPNSDKIDLIQVFEVLCPKCGQLAGRVKNPLNVFTKYPQGLPAQLCRICREKESLIVISEGTGLAS
jgi:hypothetical protein